ncbi:MAG: hypothetical protein ACKPEQ_28660, partial [Dolichospermum sp.]
GRTTGGVMGDIGSGSVPSLLLRLGERVVGLGRGAIGTGESPILAVASDGLTIVAGEASGTLHFLRLQGANPTL